MAAVFLKLLNLSISASWLVLAVLVLRLVSKRSPKWMNVLLWGIVALRLMLPFSIESALSLIPSAETLSPEIVRFDPAPTITSGVEFIDNAVNPSLSESFAAAPLASVNPLYVWTYLAGWVWLIGLGVMLLYALVSYLRLRRHVSVSLCVRENIYLCDAISSPFILGVVKPHIYLPSGLGEVQRQNVLSHERAHLARRDHWWKPLGFALLAVYWFNPVLWLAYALLCRDIELACDERVIRTMDESAVKTYSTVLLACSMPRKAVITCPLAFGEVGVKERVRNALRYKKPAFWVVAASVAVCVVVAVCFLTNPERATMKWAKSLRVEDVARIEQINMTRTPDKQYKDLDAEEFAEIVALINKSVGRYQKETELLNGRTFSLYITTTDGVRHEVVNDANVYLRIDGDSYRLTPTWRPRTTGNAPIPEGFFDESGEPAEEEMKTMTEPTLSLTLTVPAAWEDIAELSACDKGTAYLGYGIMLFHLSEKNALAAYPDGGMGSVWWLVAMSWDNFKELRGYDALPVPEILGIAEYVLGADDEYVYLLVLPSDVQFLENDPVSYRQYKALQSDSQGVLTRFLKDNGIHINDMCPASSVFSPPARGDAVRATGYAAYDALLAEIADLRRSGASDMQTDFSHDLLSANDYYQTPGWLLRDLDGDGTSELLLGADWGDGHTVIFNIYRLDGAKAVRVVDGWSRSRWYLCTDGSLAHEGSDGASEGTYSYYRYENGALRHLETVISLDGWLYSDTTDHYVGGKGFRPVSEDEANAVREKYTHETLSFTPFVV